MENEQKNYRQLEIVGQAAAVAVCEMFGINTYLSYTQANNRYGAIFRKAVKEGRLLPRYAGKGPTGKRQYAVRDVLAILQEEAAKAELRQQ